MIWKLYVLIVIINDKKGFARLKTLVLLMFVEPTQNFKKMENQESNFDINRPWLSLDPWQKEYCFDPEPNKDNFLLCGRQVGKTTAMSIRAVELAVNHYKKGEFVLINSITEKQAYHMLAKAQAYAEEVYPNEINRKKDDKPTKHRLMFKNGTGILCYAAGDTGEGLRGFTIKKLMPDEASRMSEEYFIATLPMLSIVKGTMDIASTPDGKKHRDGTEKFFYKCSKDENFKKFYVSAEDCPRHTEEYLQRMREQMSKLGYAQEFLAVFTDELKRLFDDDMINAICKGKRDPEWTRNGKVNYFLGVDVAGLGDDECTYEVFEKNDQDFINQVENITEKRNFTTDTSRKIIQLNKIYDCDKIGIDDGGLGFGVYSELMNNDDTKMITKPLNNASRDVDDEGNKSRKLLKEEMYINLQILMENNKIQLLDDDEIKASLASIQHDEGKIFGAYSHIAEGIIRAVWLASKDKSLNIWIR